MFDNFDDVSYVRGRTSESWFGTNDPTLVTQDINSYLFLNDLQNYLGTLRQNTINLDVNDIDQTKNIKFTEREAGVFSFDLASLGLIKVFEYYSPVLKKMVNGNNIITEKDAEGKTIKDSSGKPVFFHKFKPAIPEHDVIFTAEKGGYYSELLKRVVREEELDRRVVNGITLLYYPDTPEIQKHIVERRQKLNEKGKPLWATTFKKVFIEIPKIEKSLPRLDIIVSASFSSNKNARTEMIYSSMAAIALAERLSKAGVNYRIVAAFGLETTGGGTSEKCFGFINLKKEGEPLDKNRISTVLSDGRFLRYLQFMGYVAMMNDADADQKISLSGIAAPINERTFVARNKDRKFIVVDMDNMYDSNGELVAARGTTFDTEKDAVDDARSWGRQVGETKDAYIEYLKNSSNPADVKSSETPETKLIFTGALTMREAEQQYNMMMSQITRL